MFVRRSHILKKNRAREMPRHFIFFDTETTDKETADINEKELIFKLGCVCYVRVDRGSKEYFDFETIDEFWKFVISKLKRNISLYIVSHNLPFDFRIVKGFAEMNRRHFFQSKIIYEGTTNIFVYEGKQDKRLIFLDNMNFFKLPLKTLGNNIGLEKLDIKKDDLKIYCKRDVEIMVKAWDLLIHFIDSNDLGNFAPTIAGQAFNAYRHRFMNHPIYIHNISEVIADERESYHGGRTECFKLGMMPRKNYYMFDVNSMYPSVMKELEYPVKFIRTENNPSIKKLWKLLKENCVIAEVMIDTDEPVFPVKERGKLIFPTGTFRTLLTTREVEYALKAGAIINIGRVRVYKKENIFSEYVDFFYKKKKEYKESGNESFSYLCKLFLNSLYGKFGQRNKFYEPVSLKFPNDGMFYDTEKKIVYKVINGQTQKFKGFREGIDSFVSIPAHITADARMKLWRIIKSIGKKNVFYCDTDSIITSKKIKTGVKLGELSLKEKSDHLIIWGNKDYEFGKDVVMKGIKKNAEKMEDGKFKQDQFEGMAGSIQRDRINSVFVRRIEKVLKRNYDKGKVEGANIVPFKLKCQEKLY